MTRGQSMTPMRFPWPRRRPVCSSPRATAKCSLDSGPRSTAWAWCHPSRRSGCWESAWVEYRRPWEKKAPAKTVKFQVIVRRFGCRCQQSFWYRPIGVTDMKQQTIAVLVIAVLGTAVLGDASAQSDLIVAGQSIGQTHLARFGAA